MSLLERLITRPVYARDARFAGSGHYNPSVLTKLVHNYRAHPDLLALPNKLFYQNELVASADPTLTYSLSEWEYLPCQRVPIIFHGVEGKDEREESSPSWFNVSEVEQVLDYVTKLVQQTRTNAVEAREIGIITPYAKQKRKIHTALEKGLDGQRGVFKDVKVGSVEEFQGQERRVIILTTVRSSKEHVETDRKHNLGFLVNEKREEFIAYGSS